MSAPRYTMLLGVTAALLTACSGSKARATDTAKPTEAEVDATPRVVADTILVNGRLTTQDSRAPEVTAVAIKDGLVLATGDDAAISAMAGASTTRIDLQGRRVIPGLNDSHLHAVRGGRFYNLELRWDGVTSLERGLEMIAEQAKRTPEDQWVRVIGGWSPFQFDEKRSPTPGELTKASPDRPVFVLMLYSRGFLNAAGVSALGLDADTVPPPGSRYEFTEDGGAVLHAEPNPTILYKTIGALPGLSKEDMLNSTKQFYRELNGFGLTSAIDAGGGGHVFPKDYAGTERLAEAGEMPMRISYWLFPQRKGKELEDFQTWTKDWEVNQNRAEKLEHGFVTEGAGEFLVWSAGDFENFTAEMPDITTRDGWREELTAVTRHLLQAKWPIRIHATYDPSIGHILDVFEAADAAEKAEGRAGFAGIRWAIDHAETAGPENLKRIKALGGGVAVQSRMAFAGEFFSERYGAEAAASAPPLRDMLDMGIPVGAGTDATRVGSYNPWVALHWLITGETVGGAPTLSERHQLSRAEALELYTVGSAWFSGEEEVKGRIAPGQFADLAVLSEDYFEVDEAKIPGITSVLTIVGGRVVHAAGPYAERAPAMPEATPEWSPVRVFGGYQTK